MKHIFTADLKSDHVTVFGKGPTFCRISVRPGAIYAINQAAIWLMEEGIIPDLIVCNDYEPIEEINEWSVKHGVKTKLACPVYPHRNRSVSSRFNLELTHDTYHYDLWTGPKKEFAQPRFWMVDTSYNSALLIADHFGAKTIDTTGIDHGKYDSQFTLENRMSYSGTVFHRVTTGGRRVPRC